ncbi:MAG: T9SS type A sorting domain-containing protein [Bacteroidetes bacterium]|nr:T9SS type A sorting domain-containing protein [Bacteroidota bacterium]
MRKTILILLAILVVSQFVPGSVFAWDTTAAKYYPLKVGNSYTFKNKIYMLACYELNTGTSQITITGETVMPNGKKYFEFSNTYFDTTFITFWKFQRIDSATMNVYGYRTSNQTEYLIDSLLGSTNSTFKSCRFEIPAKQGIYGALQSQMIFGSQRMVRFNNVTHYPAIISYTLIEGIGYGGYYYCLDDGASSELISCVIDGVVMTPVTQTSTEVPDRFSLKQNYPNPFNPVTKINYELRTAGFVSIKVYDVMGKELSQLVNENQTTGSYEVTFDGTNLPSGVYYYRIETEGFSEVKKMNLVK